MRVFGLLEPIQTGGIDKMKCHVRETNPRVPWTQDASIRDIRQLTMKLLVLVDLALESARPRYPAHF